MHLLCAMSQWKAHIIWHFFPCSTGVTYFGHPLALHLTPVLLWLKQGYLLQTNTLLTLVIAQLLWHRSMLHEPSNFSVGPAWPLHFPPLMTCFVHPSWLQSLVLAPWVTCSPWLGFLGITLLAASSYLFGAMSRTYSSCAGLAVASLKAA